MTSAERSRSLHFLARRFSLRVRIEPAQVLTFFFFFLDFLLWGSEVSEIPTDSEICSEEDDDKLLGFDADSEELELTGLLRNGDAAAAKGSRPKNDQRFGVFVGLGMGGPTLAASATLMSAGMEFRLLGEAPTD